MVGDYYDDSSVKENLNLLLCLTQVEANIDSRRERGKGSLKGFFKGQGCWGLPQLTLGNDRLRKSFSRFKTKSAHSRVVRRLLEIRKSREN